MKVILISGKARTGKDTMAIMLKNRLERKGNEVLITHFGDLLKFVCEKYFGWVAKKMNMADIYYNWLELMK